MFDTMNVKAEKQKNISAIVLSAQDFITVHSNVQQFLHVALDTIIKYKIRMALKSQLKNLTLKQNHTVFIPQSAHTF